MDQVLAMATCKAVAAREALTRIADRIEAFTNEICEFEELVAQAKEAYETTTCEQKRNELDDMVLKLFAKYLDEM
jgi:hypothetical protein